MRSDEHGERHWTLIGSFNPPRCLSGKGGLCLHFPGEGAVWTVVYPPSPSSYSRDPGSECRQTKSTNSPLGYGVLTDASKKRRSFSAHQTRSFHGDAGWDRWVKTGQTVEMWHQAQCPLKTYVKKLSGAQLLFQLCKEGCSWVCYNRIRLCGAIPEPFFIPIFELFSTQDCDKGP